MKKVFVAVSVALVVLILIAGIMVFSSDDPIEPLNSPSEPEKVQEDFQVQSAPDPFETIPTEDQNKLPGPVKEFTITGENFKFLENGVENPTLTVNNGDFVIITFVSTSGFHDWVVDEFGAATTRVNDGEFTTVEFLADKSGTFSYYCSVGSHRAQGMQGLLVVT